MNRTLLILAALLPSLALACGPGAGCSSATGVDALACLLFVVVLAAPLWVPVVALVGLGVLFTVLARKAPARVSLRPAARR